MCGIIGIFDRENAGLLVKKGLGLMKRGSDSWGISDGHIQHAPSLKRLKAPDSDRCIGHCLHAVVSKVQQPVGRITANCEIYNWKELAKVHSIKAKNDAELLGSLLDKNGIEAIDELDGDYAFAYWGEDLILARDILGVKPLFFSTSNGFAFASEGKVLKNLGYDVEELNPRKILVYDGKVRFIKRKFFSIGNTKKSKEEILKELEQHLIEAVRKRIPDKRLGILFSGGVDSSVLAAICKHLGKEVTLYTTALDEKTMSTAEDLKYSKKVAEHLGLKLRVRKISLKDVESYAKVVVPLIEDSNVTKVGVGLTFYPACELAREDGMKVMFSGLGSEEIFAGYQRHKRSLDVNKECLSGLLKLYERDTYRDDVITMHNNLELRVPFLDRQLIEFALRIPGRYKIDKIEKQVLREVAEKWIGEYAWRKKRAAQYGSKTDRAIEKLAKKSGCRLKSQYLRQFFPENLRLGALVSGGKDSLYAMYVMHRQNYSIRCIITIKSRNTDSFMFHTPAIDVVDLQAEALGLPYLAIETEGKKESELADLKKALMQAKKKHRLEGIITGALYSTYQRDRIEKICDELGLKIFSPLWHIDQETEMREILREGFEFVFSAIAAEGLNSSWVGRKITSKDVDRLVKLNKKIGLNIAGEGGEFESLVLDMPMFSKRIAMDSEVISESEIIARLNIKKAWLENRTHP